jgi:hypothetical protein
MFKRCIVTLILASAILVRPVPGSAYEIDVHFYLTYVLARLAGFSIPDASLIARADQSMDDNRTTTAFAFPLPPLHYREHGKLWHAFNVNQDAVMQRFRDLQCRAGVSETADRGLVTTCDSAISVTYPIQLVYLGQFLHYYQDTYAHSNRNEMAKNWSTYRPTFGHLFAGIRPDLVPNRPALAQSMAWDVFCALKAFAMDHGKTLSSNPSHKQINELVVVLARAYDRRHRPATDPSASADTSILTDSNSYHKSADLHNVRCALSAYVNKNDLLPTEPDLQTVGYVKLAFDESGNPQPPPSLESSRHDPITCADRIAHQRRDCRPPFTRAPLTLNATEPHPGRHAMGTVAAAADVVAQGPSE